jgi:hypothetical protein
MDLEGMYIFLEQGKKKPDKGDAAKKDRITLPDREGVSGDGNKSGIPRSPKTSAGDEWGGEVDELDKETKGAQKKYKGNFDREEMYRLAGRPLEEAADAKVTKSDAKFYYVDVPGYGEVKIRKGNLLGVDKPGIPADVILKAFKAAGKERNKEQAARWDKFKRTLKPLSSKKPKSRSISSKKPKSRSIRPKK